MTGGRARAPRVSVLLPVRDGAPFLARALRSLASQSFRDLEVVAVDDGSEDDTFTLLRAFAAADPRVRVVRQPRLGIVSALETAREAARGELLARMDADDLSLPRRLERQVEALDADPGLAVVGCGVRIVPREGLTEGRLEYERWLNSLTSSELIHRDLFVECPLAHPTLVLRRETLEAVGGYRNAAVPEDYDLLLRIHEAGGRLGTVPEPLLEWTDRPDRLSRTDPAYSLEAFRALKVEVLGRTLLRGWDGVVIWGAGPTGKAFSRLLREAGVVLRAFVDLDPRKIGQEIHGAPVLPPHGLDDHPGAFVLAAVAGMEGREEVRAALRRAGRREGRDFVAVA